MGKTIALDLALQTGVATQADGDLCTMVWDVKGDEQAPTRTRSIGPCIRLIRHLDVEHNSRTVTKLVLENAFTSHAAQAWLQNSLQTSALLWAYRHGIRYSRYATMSWKLAVLGSGRVSRDEYHRRAREKWPELDIQTNDEAAALWLLEMDRITTEGKYEV